jgi:virulence factor Mce-like protein
MAHLNIDRLRLELRRSRGPFALLIGLIVAAGVAAALIAHNLTFVRPWDSYSEVKVAFQDVKGIFPGGHQVRISGVKVGVVSKAQVIDGRPVLTLKIQKKWGHVYRDAKIRIRPVTPLEDLYVDVVDRGHPRARVASGSYIIPAGQTITPVDISRVLDTFNADTRARMTILLSELGRGLSDRGAQLRAAFAELAPFLKVAQQTTQALHERQSHVKRLVSNFGLLSAALAHRDTQIRLFVDAGDATLGQLAAHDRPLDATFASLARLVPVMRSSFASVQQLSDHLDPALVSLRPVADNLAPGLSALERVGTQARPAFRRLQPAIQELRPMARILSPTSSSLQRSFERLGPQAPQYDHLTQVLEPCMGTLNDFFQNTLSVFKFYDGNGAFPRADEIVDTASSAGPLQGPPLNLHRLPQCHDGVK